MACMKRAMISILGVTLTQDLAHVLSLRFGRTDRAQRSRPSRVDPVHPFDDGVDFLGGVFDTLPSVL